MSSNLVPRVSNLTALWSERRETLAGSGHIPLWQLRTSGRVLCNQQFVALSFLEFKVLPCACHYLWRLSILSFQAEISNNIYSNVYLKVKSKSVSGNLVVVIFSVLPPGFMESHSYFNCGHRAAQFHPVVIVVSPLNAHNQIGAKNIRMSPGKRITFPK